MADVVVQSRGLVHVLVVWLRGCVRCVEGLCILSRWAAGLLDCEDPLYCLLLLLLLLLGERLWWFELWQRVVVETRVVG